MRNKILPSISLCAGLFTLAIAGQALNANAQLLFSEGFNYTAGSSLGVNAPWGGSSSTNLQVGSGALSYSGLNVLPGNSLLVANAAASSVTNIFTTTAVTSGNIYFSFLVDATMQPTVSSDYLLSLNPATSKPNGSSDTVAIYYGTDSTGWKIGVRTPTAGASYVSTVLNQNQTYFVVGEYNFTTFTASLFLDPVPGNSQPGTASVSVTGVATTGGIQNIGVKSQSVTAAGDFTVDNLLIGDTYADVTPAMAAPEPSTLALSAVGLVGLAVRFRRSRS